MSPQKILKLSVSNLMRVSAIEITPEGNLVVLSGDNGQGKTSVLNAIWFALGGTRNIVDEPIQRGKTKAHATVELTDLIVTRAWSLKGGTTLTVTNKEGAPLKSPQDLLNGLLGSLSFDPLDFSRLAASKRAEDRRQAVSILKSLVNLDFSDLDDQREIAASKRTNVNRERDTIEVQLNTTPNHADAPETEISTADLVDQLEKAQDHNKKIDDQLAQAQRLNFIPGRDGSPSRPSDDEEEKPLIASAVERLTETAEEILKHIHECERQINSLTDKRKKVLQQIEETKADAKTIRDAIAAGKPRIDANAILIQLQGADAKNAKVRVNKKRKELSQRFQELSKKTAAFTEEIQKIDQSKLDHLAAAKFPVQEISFDDDGVKLSGLPFEQASAAEQIRASVAMGIALNPTLKVILVRDGADHLDQKSLALIKTMADQNNIQIWMERIVTDAATSFVIEDGHLAEASA